MILESVRSQIIDGLQSGGINIGGIDATITMSEAMKTQMMNLLIDQFANSLNGTMKVGIVIILFGTVALLLISSHIRSKKGAGNTPAE